MTSDPNQNILTIPSLDLIRRELARLTDQKLIEAHPQCWVEIMTYNHPLYHHRLAHTHYYVAHHLDS